MAYVPSKDDNYFFPQWTLEFIKMVDHGINCWLYGGTGAGKSSLVEQVCATGELPLIYQSFHEDLKPDQLKGSMTLVDGNTVWQDGPVTKAYREGFVLLLDEFDAFPPEVQFCLFAVLDRKPLILEENDNEVVQPHPNFRVVATGNTQGRGDESGMYAGTNILNRALLNRIGPWYKVDYPTQKVYKDLIMKEGVSEEVATVMSRLAKEINSACDNGTLTETFSLRDARRMAVVAELCDGDMNRALQLCLLNRLSSVEKGAVTELFRRLVPDDM
jgi:cobaltochelatase CobS